nr:hypothetical protein [uncultured Brevundimonas sp.]
MTTGLGSPKFSQRVLAEVGAFPRKGIVYIGLVCAAAQMCNLLLWSKADASTVIYVILAAILLAWFCVSYATASAILNVPPSVSGLFKFLAASLLTSLPVLLSLALLVFASKTSIAIIYVLSGLLMLGGVFLLPLLAGWPITQAISTRLIGPMTALRATKGHRGNLIVAALLVAGLNRIVPALNSATDFTTACWFAVMGFIADIASAMALISIAVVASQMMSANLVRK